MPDAADHDDPTDLLLDALQLPRPRPEAIRLGERMRTLTILQALRCCPRLVDAEKMLRGEHLPRRHLDKAWLRAYGR